MAEFEQEIQRNYEDRFMEMAERAEKGWNRYDRMVDRMINPKKALLFRRRFSESE